MEARAETIVKADMLAMLGDQNGEDITAATMAFSLLKTSANMASQ